MCATVNTLVVLVKLSVRSVCRCVWTLTFKLIDIFHAASSWSYLGQSHESWSSSQSHNKMFLFFCYGCTWRGGVIQECSYTTWRIMFVCRVLCAKAVGATSSKVFLVIVSFWRYYVDITKSSRTYSH